MIATRSKDKYEISTGEPTVDHFEVFGREWKVCCQSSLVGARMRMSLTIATMMIPLEDRDGHMHPF